MPRNGSGTYTLPELPFVEGTVIDEVAVNSDFSDIATALTNSVARNGEAAMTGNLPMGGFKLTNLAAGSSPNDSVRFEQVFTSPAFTGTPTAPTAAAGTSTTQIATTAFAQTMQSPAFTGTPTAPTASPNTNTTQIATTAYVDAADSLKANINSPALTGTPTAPTASANNNSTQIATTAYVDAADALKANINSPALTGTPTAPTAPGGTNTTQIATTAFVIAQAMNVELPLQSGNAGKFLTTDGTSASWASAGSTSSAQSSGTNIALATSADTVIRITTTAANLSVTLYNATSQGGRVHVFTNAGTNTWHLYDNGANYIRTVHPGGRVAVRLVDDTTAAGVWRVDFEQNCEVMRLRTATVLNSALSFATGSCWIGGNKYVAAYNTASDAVVRVVDAASIDSPTLGTAVSFPTSAASVNTPRLISLGTDSAIIFWRGAADAVSARVISVTGTTISLGSIATVAGGATGGGTIVSPVQVNTNAFVVFHQSSTANTLAAVACTVSGTTVTFGTSVNLGTSALVTEQTLAYVGSVSSDEAYCVYWQATTNRVLTANRVTRSGTTITDQGFRDWTVPTGLFTVAANRAPSNGQASDCIIGISTDTTNHISTAFAFDAGTNRWIGAPLFRWQGLTPTVTADRYDGRRLFCVVSATASGSTKLALLNVDRGGVMSLSPQTQLYANSLGANQWTVSQANNVNKALFVYSDATNSNFPTARIIEVGP